MNEMNRGMNLMKGMRGAVQTVRRRMQKPRYTLDSQVYRTSFDSITARTVFKLLRLVDQYPYNLMQNVDSKV